MPNLMTPCSKCHTACRHSEPQLVQRANFGSNFMRHIGLAVLNLTHADSDIFSNTVYYGWYCVYLHLFFFFKILTVVSLVIVILVKICSKHPILSKFSPKIKKFWNKNASISINIV